MIEGLLMLSLMLNIVVLILMVVLFKRSCQLKKEGAKKPWEALGNNIETTGRLLQEEIARNRGEVLMGDLKLPSIAIKVVPCLGAARLLAYHAASHCSTRLSRHKSSRFVILTALNNKLIKVLPRKFTH
jgi:hypothetical protein